jgi:hypothetical protein
MASESRVSGDSVARSVTLTIGAFIAAASFLGGCANEGAPAGVDSENPSESVAAVALSGPGSDCGSVTYPGGSVGTVYIASGNLTCTDALAAIDRYLHDPELIREGNTLSAGFDGWGCASPTATAAEIYGYSTSCERGSDAVQIRVGSTPDAPAAPLSYGCDPAGIARDLGTGATAVRCYDQWAYIDFGELGDSQALARTVNGAWTVYTGFPSSKCRTQAAADGVPAPELSSFRSC